MPKSKALCLKEENKKRQFRETLWLYARSFDFKRVYNSFNKARKSGSSGSVKAEKKCCVSRQFDQQMSDEDI